MRLAQTMHLFELAGPSRCDPKCSTRPRPFQGRRSASFSNPVCTGEVRRDPCLTSRSQAPSRLLKSKISILSAKIDRLSDAFGLATVPPTQTRRWREPLWRVRRRIDMNPTTQKPPTRPTSSRDEPARVSRWINRDRPLKVSRGCAKAPAAALSMALDRSRRSDGRSDQVGKGGQYS